MNLKHFPAYSDWFPKGVWGPFQLSEDDFTNNKYAYSNLQNNDNLVYPSGNLSLEKEREEVTRTASVDHTYSGQSPVTDASPLTFKSSQQAYKLEDLKTPFTVRETELQRGCLRLVSLEAVPGDYSSFYFIIAGSALSAPFLTWICKQPFHQMIRWSSKNDGQVQVTCRRETESRQEEEKAGMAGPTDCL